MGITAAIGNGGHIIGMGPQSHKYWYGAMQLVWVDGNDSVSKLYLNVMALWPHERWTTLLYSPLLCIAYNPTVGHQ